MAELKQYVASPHLFVFSDDPEWVANNFDSSGCHWTVVRVGETTTPWEDMHLMSLCKHHIISNSTFSWWGAWLANSEGIVIAPSLWLSDGTLAADILPQEWISISPKQ